jgi:hypothetical protein
MKSSDPNPRSDSEDSDCCDEEGTRHSPVINELLGEQDWRTFAFGPDYFTVPMQYSVRDLIGKGAYGIVW